MNIDKYKSYRAAISSLILILLCSATALGNGTDVVQIDRTKPRLLVLTDIGGDPDDQQSLVRLLLYSNEFDIEGIVVEGWKKYSGYEQMAVAQNIIDNYRKVRPNLLRHDPNFPTVEHLTNILKRGVVDVVKYVGKWETYIGEGKDTEGSRHIVTLLEKEDPRPLDISIWGGAADLAQALWWLKENRTPHQMKKVIANLRVYSIAHQDITGKWILETFPDLFFILNEAEQDIDEVQHIAMESGFRGMYLGGNKQLTLLSWVDEHVRQGHGSLGKQYPARTTNPNSRSLKEGDTPSWFYFYQNGLNQPQYPAYGGWGGRFKPKASYYNDASDIVDGKKSSWASIWRWRPAFQNDFEARMDWCVKSYDEANHNPLVLLNGEGGKGLVNIKAFAGEEVFLSAEGSSDPDGDDLNYRWFIYEDAGSKNHMPNIKNENTQKATVQLSSSAKLGQQFHVVLEVKDNGHPALTSYRRALITIQENQGK